LETQDVNARFINGKPQAIESIYVMKNSEAWDRFMRFMERYGETNGLVLPRLLNYLIQIKENFSFCNVGKTIFRVLKILYFNGNKF
jgi:hypothetical protein